MFVFFLLVRRRPPRSTRTATLFPYTTLVRSGLARNLDRGAHRPARFFRIPQIAFEIEDRTGGDQIAVERAFGQELRRAEKGVHRPLAIGGDEDQAARGGGLARAPRGI